MEGADCALASVLQKSNAEKARIKILCRFMVKIVDIFYCVNDII
jgi:hypothetical protein